MLANDGIAESQNQLLKYPKPDGELIAVLPRQNIMENVIVDHELPFLEV